MAAIHCAIIFDDQSLRGKVGEQLGTKIGIHSCIFTSGISFEGVELFPFHGDGGLFLL